MTEVPKPAESSDSIILGEMRETLFYIQEWQNYLVGAHPQNTFFIEKKAEELRKGLGALKNESINLTDSKQIEDAFYNFKLSVHDQFETLSHELGGTDANEPEVEATVPEDSTVAEDSEQPNTAPEASNEETAQPNTAESLPAEFIKNITDANDFAELYAAIKEQKEIPYSQGILSADDLITIIDMYRDGDKDRLINIPRGGNLRETVMDLAHRERVSEKIQQANTLPELYDALNYIESIDEDGKTFAAANIISNIDRYHDLRDESVLFNIPKTGGIRDKARDIVLRQIIDENSHPVRTAWRKFKGLFS